MKTNPKDPENDRMEECVLSVNWFMATIVVASSLSAAPLTAARLLSVELQLCSSWLALGLGYLFSLALLVCTMFWPDEEKPFTVLGLFYLWTLLLLWSLVLPLAFLVVWQFPFFWR